MSSLSLSQSVALTFDRNTSDQATQNLAQSTNHHNHSQNRFQNFERGRGRGRGHGWHNGRNSGRSLNWNSNHHNGGASTRDKGWQNSRAYRRPQFLTDTRSSMPSHDGRLPLLPTPPYQPPFQFQETCQMCNRQGHTSRVCHDCGYYAYMAVQHL
ncbi:unnamed protein product [Prunus brigantina]